MPPSGMADKLGNAGEACDTEPRARRVVVHRAIGIVTVARFCTTKLHAVVTPGQAKPPAASVKFYQSLRLCAASLSRQRHSSRSPTLKKMPSLQAAAE
jgi:hypothetical protein